MDRYSLIHLGDDALLQGLATLVHQDRATTASLLAHLAEVDARRLYLPAAYPSMFEYCIHELRLSEDSAYKRIRAARTARQFPAIFEALADGRLHLAAVVLLAPHLNPENASELMEAAAGKPKSEIEQLIAERFPRTELLPLVCAVPEMTAADVTQLAPGQVGAHSANGVSEASCQLAPGRVGTTAESRIAPIAPERYALHLTFGWSAHDKLRYAQALLGHAVPSGDVAEVIERALDALIVTLEKRKFAATRRPQQKRRPTASRRHVPAHVKRAVWQRDGGRCTFVSEAGRRCDSRTRLEFDHVEEVARGGEATVDGIRLRCRAHNQFAAECAFGAGFMEDKRRAARQTAEERRWVAAERRRAETERKTAEAERRRAATERRKAEAEYRRAAAEEARRHAAAEAARTQAATDDVVPWLRQLGLRPDDARRAAAACASIPGASLEQRVRAALACHGRARFHLPAMSAMTGP